MKTSNIQSAISDQLASHPGCLNGIKCLPELIPLGSSAAASFPCCLLSSGQAGPPGGGEPGAEQGTGRQLMKKTALLCLGPAVFFFPPIVKWH